MNGKLHLKNLKEFLVVLVLSVLYLNFYIVNGSLIALSKSSLTTRYPYVKTPLVLSQKNKSSQNGLHLNLPTNKMHGLSSSIAQTLYRRGEMASIPKKSRWPIKRTGRNKRLGNYAYDYGYNNCDYYDYGGHSCRPTHQGYRRQETYYRPYGIPGLQSQYGILNSLLNEQLNKLSPGSNVDVLSANLGTISDVTKDLKEFELIREKLRLKEELNLFGRIPYGNAVHHYHGPRYQHKRPPYHNHHHHGNFNQHQHTGWGWSKGDDDSSEEDDSEEKTQKDNIKYEQRKTAQLQLLNTLLIEAGTPSTTAATTTTTKPSADKAPAASVILCIFASAVGSGGTMCGSPGGGGGGGEKPTGKPEEKPAGKPENKPAGGGSGSGSGGGEKPAEKPAPKMENIAPLPETNILQSASPPSYNFRSGIIPFEESNFNQQPQRLTPDMQGILDELMDRFKTENTQTDTNEPLLRNIAPTASFEDDYY